MFVVNTFTPYAKALSEIQRFKNSHLDEVKIVKSNAISSSSHSLLKL
jgi:hypothetical protein